MLNNNEEMNFYSYKDSEGVDYIEQDEFMSFV